MYDLHAHILPGVDDGAKTVEDTIAMARVAAENGTLEMLCTPHRKDITENFSVAYVQELVEKMNRELQAQNIGLKFLVGMENHLDIDLPAEFTAGRALRINGSRYALVELPFFGKANFIEDTLFKIQLQGITPVLAHPERLECFQQEPDLLAKFVESGMLSQVTAGSVVGHFGEKVKKITNNMLRCGLVHILSSDTHFPHGPRSPKLPPGRDAAALIVGEERARAMVVDTPRAVLRNEIVKVPSPSEAVEPKKKWWKLGRG
ncbi:MAG: tyrosine protein phosphatase [SAR202 cluster bacterium]|nr:tyrosine protein phosphatase [SAR202 cluster bacterium]